MTDEEEFLEWKTKRDERLRKQGAYWLTPEGRAELLDVFTDDSGGNAVFPLLMALSRVEQVAARLLVLATKHCPSDHEDFEEIKRIAGDG